MTDAHPRDALVPLALDQLAPEERDRALRHLTGCPACRHEYDALAATVEATLHAAPAVDPPSGFEGRVLATLGLDRAEGVASRSSGEPTPWRRSLRSRWAVVAAGVAAGLAIGLAGGLAWDGPERATVVAEPGSVDLTAADGSIVGRVTPAVDEGRAVLVVSVHSATRGMTYRCRLRLSDGSTVDVADWELRERFGSWVVDVPDGGVDEVLLVANRGAGPVWSRGAL